MTFTASKSLSRFSCLTLSTTFLRVVWLESLFLCFSLSNLFACVNSAANFLIYMLRGKKFRDAFLQTYGMKRRSASNANHRLMMFSTNGGGSPVTSEVNRRSQRLIWMPWLPAFNHCDQYDIKGVPSPVTSEVNRRSQRLIWMPWLPAFNHCDQYDIKGVPALWENTLKCFFLIFYWLQNFKLPSWMSLILAIKSLPSLIKIQVVFVLRFTSFTLRSRPAVFIWSSLIIVI